MISSAITTTTFSLLLGNASGDADVFSTSPTTPPAANSSSTYNPVFPAYIRTTSMVFCIVIMCLGVVGNVMVPIVIFKTKDMRNSTNIFLVNLSIADLMVLLVCTPTVLVEVNSRPEVWVLGEEMCKAVPFVELTVAHASVLTILAISFERYYAICKPLKAGYICTKTRASLICLLAWCVAAVFTSPILGIAEYHQQVDYFDGSKVPACHTRANTFWPALYFLATAFTFFILPLVVLIALYLVIAKRLVSHAASVVLHKHHPDKCAMRARKQAILMLGTVVLSFFLCLIPFRVFTIWIIIVPEQQFYALGVEKYYNILYFCRIMVYINSAVNPILYNLMSSKFRTGFLICSACRRRRYQQATCKLKRACNGTLSTSASTKRCVQFRSSEEAIILKEAHRSQVEETIALQDTCRSLCALKRHHDMESFLPILSITQYSVEEYFDSTMVTVCFSSVETLLASLYFLLTMSVFFFLPLGILIVVYALIAKTLMDHPNLMAAYKNNAATQPSQSVLKYRKQVVAMLATVVVAFFVCLLPFRALTLWIIVAPAHAITDIGIECYYNLIYFCRIMFHINSAINPILYNIMSSKFRVGFLRVCGVQRRRLKRQQADINRKNTFNTSSTTNTASSQHTSDSLFSRYSSKHKHKGGHDPDAGKLQKNEMFVRIAITPFRPNAPNANERRISVGESFV